MLTSLIETHAKLEKELERAISDNSASPVIEAIDRKMTDLDNSIRQSVPTSPDEAKVKLDFFLSRIAIVGSAVVSRRDIEAIEELFDQLLGNVGNTEQSEEASSDPRIVSTHKP